MRKFERSAGPPQIKSLGSRCQIDLSTRLYRQGREALTCGGAIRKSVRSRWLSRPSCEPTQPVRHLRVMKGACEGPGHVGGGLSGSSSGRCAQEGPGYAVLVPPQTAATELADVVLWAHFLSLVPMIHLLPLFVGPVLTSGLLCHRGSTAKSACFYCVVSSGEWVRGGASLTRYVA